MMTEKGKRSRYRVYSFAPLLELWSTSYAGSDREIGVPFNGASLHAAGMEHKRTLGLIDCVRLEPQRRPEGRCCGIIRGQWR